MQRTTMLAIGRWHQTLGRPRRPCSSSPAPVLDQAAAPWSRRRARPSRRCRQGWLLQFPPLRTTPSQLKHAAAVVLTVRTEASRHRSAGQRRCMRHSMPAAVNKRSLISPRHPGLQRRATAQQQHLEATFCRGMLHDARRHLLGQVLQLVLLLLILLAMITLTSHGSTRIHCMRSSALAWCLQLLLHVSCLLVVQRCRLLRVQAIAAAALRRQRCRSTVPTTRLFGYQRPRAARRWLLPQQQH